MKKFEYTSENLTYHEVAFSGSTSGIPYNLTLSFLLNYYGKDGWELISVCMENVTWSQNLQPRFYFKRELDDSNT